MMTRSLKIASSALALAGALCAAAQAAPTHKVFVTCPILRNTELPCWLGRSEGVLYYLGSQGDLTSAFYPPQFQHRMLVEGVVSDRPAQCGGVVLDSVKVSVLPGLAPECNVMLPAEGFDPPEADRGVGPSGVRGGQPPPPRERPGPRQFTAPFDARTFEAPFNADSERLWADAQTALGDAVRYANLVKAKTVVISGARAAMRLSDGTDYVERPDIAERRAKAAETAVRKLGLPAATTVKVQWDNTPNVADGANDAGHRRATVMVTPP